mmetsp:Transcript_120096/g.179434  ORF Transcript_120096/g.179434 Transcript_120096/m.179434 type:complete len:188 (-) Transcript_120096:553-1116(-)
MPIIKIQPPSNVEEDELVGSLRHSAVVDAVVVALLAVAAIQAAWLSRLHRQVLLPKQKRSHGYFGAGAVVDGERVVVAATAAPAGAWQWQRQYSHLVVAMLMPLPSSLVGNVAVLVANFSTRVAHMRLATDLTTTMMMTWRHRIDAGIVLAAAAAVCVGGINSGAGVVVVAAQLQIAMQHCFPCTAA